MFPHEYANELASHLLIRRLR